MSSEMIERVAKALHFSRQESDWPNEVFDGEWEDLTDEARYEFTAAARTAVEAMREPTLEMRKAAVAAWNYNGAGVDQATIYQAMIDAALSPSPNLEKG